MTEKNNIEYWLNEVHQGDAIEKLKKLPEESVDLVVTSPPYYQLRDYGEEGQIGLEKSLKDFIKNLTKIGDEIHRVLKSTGSFYLNLGDTYAGGSANKKSTFSNKCKMLIPHKVASSLIDNGWICRNDIVWAKPNSMPESVTDRRSTKFEYVFHFVKQQDYYYDLDSIRVPNETEAQGTPGTEKTQKESFVEGKRWSDSTTLSKRNPKGKNPGDIQEVNTANNSEAHFAVFPKELIEPHIKSSCPEDGVVLDPFMGSGTTAVVSEKLGRDWIGIDLNKDYIEMSYDRIDDETKRIFDDRSVFDY